MNVFKKILVLSVIVFAVACEAEKKGDFYEKNGVSLEFVDGWRFSGDSDFYWAADRAVSAETEALSALSLLIYKDGKHELSEINVETIVARVLPRYVKEIEEELVIKHEAKDITYGSHNGVRLTYESTGDIAEVFLFEMSAASYKAFVLFITDKEDLVFVESTMLKMLDGIKIEI